MAVMRRGEFGESEEGTYKVITRRTKSSTLTLPVNLISVE
jgi:hypothetical protein